MAGRLGAKMVEKKVERWADVMVGLKAEWMAGH